MNQSLVRLIIFLLSPLFSLPFILHGIYKRNKNSVFLFVLIISVISYLYIPLVTNDKAYYYELYETLNYSSLNDFYNHFLVQKTDFIFYLLIYLFKVLGIPLHFLFFCLTAITLSLWFSILLQVLDLYPEKKKGYFFMSFLLIFFSFSLSGLFSGVRFYLAISFAFYGFISGILLKKSMLKSMIFILLSSLTHFSCIVFIPLFVVVYYKPYKNNLYLYMFLGSLVFVLIPRQYLLDKISLISLDEVYKSKVDSYLGDTDYIENSIKVGNFNNYLKYFFKTIWVYLGYAYLFFIKRQSVLRNCFLLVLTLCNIFFSAPTVYNRYLILALGLFIIMVIYDNLTGVFNKKYIYILLLILGLNFVGNIYIMKENFTRSLKDVHSFSLLTILLKEDIKYNEIK